MAKVYEVPRYRSQTAYKVSAFLSCASESDDTIAKTTHSWFNRHALGLEEDEAYGISEAEATFLAALEVEMPLLNDEIMEADLPTEIEVLRQAYESGFRMKGQAGYMRVAAYGSVLARIITLVRRGRKPVMTDSAATFDMVSRYISGEYKSTISNRCQRLLKQATSVTRDFVKATLSADNLGAELAAASQRDVLLPGESNGLCSEYLAWCEATEKLQLPSMTPAVKESHKEIETVWNIPSRFKVNDTYAGEHLGRQSRPLLCAGV